MVWWVFIGVNLLHLLKSHAHRARVSCKGEILYSHRGDNLDSLNYCTHMCPMYIFYAMLWLWYEPCCVNVHFHTNHPGDIILIFCTSALECSCKNIAVRTHFIFVFWMQLLLFYVLDDICFTATATYSFYYFFNVQQLFYTHYNTHEILFSILLFIVYNNRLNYF